MVDHRKSRRPNEKKQRMTKKQETPYQYAIEDCDVTDKKLLAEFRARRLVWLDWLEKDECHAIWPEISSALWNDVAFRTFAKMAEDFPASALHNSLLTEALIRGYFSGQVLTIRRLMDKRKDVISLRRVLGEIKDNLHLFTRENYVAHDGLPYDYEEVERQTLLAHLNSGPFWADRTGPNASIPAKMRHQTFDWLCELQGQTRNRSDCLSQNILITLEQWLDGCGADEIVTWSHKMLAHAADEASRGRVDLQSINPNLQKITEVHKAFVCVAEALANFVLCDSGHGMVVPVPQFNQFEKLEGAVLETTQMQPLRDFWHALSKERDGWIGDTEAMLKKPASGTMAA